MFYFEGHDISRIGGTTSLSYEIFAFRQYYYIQVKSSLYLPESLVSPGDMSVLLPDEPPSPIKYAAAILTVSYAILTVAKPLKEISYVLYLKSLLITPIYSALPPYHPTTLPTYLLTYLPTYLPPYLYSCLLIFIHLLLIILICNNLIKSFFLF